MLRVNAQCNFVREGYLRGTLSSTWSCFYIQKHVVWVHFYVIQFSFGVMDIIYVIKLPFPADKCNFDKVFSFLTGACTHYKKT